MPPTEPPKDDETKVGDLSTKELSMLIVAFAFAIVMVTYSVAIIMGLSNPDTSITITGTIDLSKFEGAIFTIIGGGLIILGITTAPKIAKALK